ncbi:MAG: hypothetical protein AMXMBFR64_23330 [Myxococcales bacterium]
MLLSVLLLALAAPACQSAGGGGGKYSQSMGKAVKPLTGPTSEGCAKCKRKCAAKEGAKDCNAQCASVCR